MVGEHGTVLISMWLLHSHKALEVETQSCMEGHTEASEGTNKDVLRLAIAGKKEVRPIPGKVLKCSRETGVDDSGRDGYARMEMTGSVHVAEVAFQMETTTRNAAGPFV